jgi:hypothetical protein
MDEQAAPANRGGLACEDHVEGRRLMGCLTPLGGPVSVLMYDGLNSHRDSR